MFNGCINIFKDDFETSYNLSVPESDITLSKIVNSSLSMGLESRQQVEDVLNDAKRQLEGQTQWLLEATGFSSAQGGRGDASSGKGGGASGASR